MTNKDCPRYKKCRQEWANAKYRESVVFTCYNCIREVEEPITLTDEQITEMWESGYISDKEEYKDGND